MNTSILADFAVSEADFTLPADDTQGIEWLYDYHIEKQTKLTQCPEQYVYDAKRKECVAPLPLIFMVIKGNLDELKNFIQDNPELDLNAQDKHGNTALHYAAEHARLKKDERGMYDHLLAAGANNALKNKHGITPAEVLVGKALFRGEFIDWCATGLHDYKRNKLPKSGFAITGTSGNNYVLTLLILLLPLLACVLRVLTAATQ